MSRRGVSFASVDALQARQCILCPEETVRRIPAHIYCISRTGSFEGPVEYRHVAPETCFYCGGPTYGPAVMVPVCGGPDDKPNRVLKPLTRRPDDTPYREGRTCPSCGRSPTMDGRCGCS